MGCSPSFHPKCNQGINEIQNSAFFPSFFYRSSKRQTENVIKITHQSALTVSYYTILFRYYTIPKTKKLSHYYTILYYTILYYTILYYTILYYTILFRRLLQLPTEIDLLRQSLQSYGTSYRLPLDIATVLIVLKGR